MVVHREKVGVCCWLDVDVDLFFGVGLHCGLLGEVCVCGAGGERLCLGLDGGVHDNFCFDRVVLMKNLKSFKKNSFFSMKVERGRNGKERKRRLCTLYGYQ